MRLSIAHLSPGPDWPVRSDICSSEVAKSCTRTIDLGISSGALIHGEVGIINWPYQCVRGASQCRSGDALSRRRTKRLAVMAHLLDGEDLSDAPLALALLTGGAIDQHADDVSKAWELVRAVHHLKERFRDTVYGLDSTPFEPAQ
jgi:hypothetical protein